MRHKIEVMLYNNYLKDYTAGEVSRICGGLGEGQAYKHLRMLWAGGRVRLKNRSESDWRKHRFGTLNQDHHSAHMKRMF